MIENVPAELKELPQWVIWRRESRDGKTTKIPYDAKTGQRASSTGPESWTTFDYASGAAKFADGIGFVFTVADPYAGIDLDDCVRDGDLHPEAAKIVQQLDSYTELSPSGTGVHVIIKSDIPYGRGRKTSTTPWGGAFEIYDRGRFFTCTGKLLRVPVDAWTP